MTDRGRRGVPMSWIAVTAFFALVALPRPAIPLIDGDVWWHIRAGEQVLTSGRVPTADTWSMVGSGMPWTSQDWLANVLLALGHRLGELGASVLSVGAALLVVLTLAVLWRGIGLRVASAGWLGRIVLLAAGLVVAGPVVGVRVQVVDLLLGALVLVTLWAFLARRRPLVLAWLPAITLAWANLHAGWPLVFLLGGAVVVGEATDRLLRRRLDPEPLAWRQVAWLAAALVACVPVIALNPNGLALYAYPLETSSIAAHADFLAEWRPPNPASIVGQAFIGFVAFVAVPALLVGWRRLRLADALIIAGLTLMAAIGARFLLLTPLVAAVAAVPLLPWIATTRVGNAAGPLLRRMAEPRPGTRSALNLVLVLAVVAAGLAVTWSRVSPGAQRHLIGEHMPVGAVDWVVANQPGRRPFNQYSWGGYLGFRRPDAPVYIDGRSDIYGDAPIRRYADVISLRADPQAELDSRDIDHVLFPVGTPFAGWLDEQPAWERAYADELAAVWVRAP